MSIRTPLAFTLLVFAGLWACFYFQQELDELLPPPTPRVLTPIQQALKAAELDKDSGSGSCFPVVVRDGMVGWLTNHHVVASPFWLMAPETKVVVTPNGDRLPVHVTVIHPSRDVALVWTAMNPANPIEPLPLAASDAEPGDFAILAGYPAEAGLWISAGFVAGLDKDGDRWSSVPIYYGCSGGPVLVNGRVVGVARAVHVDEHRGQVISTISAFVPLGSFRDWLEQVTTAGANLK